MTVFFDKKAEKRVTTKDVLRAMLEWRKKIDDQGGPSNCTSISKELYKVIEAFQRGIAETAIDHEVFDDPMEAGQ